MNPIDSATAKKALSLYFKGLIQDYYQVTGQQVTAIHINSRIEDNKWQVDNVEITTDLETPLWSDFT